MKKASILMRNEIAKLQPKLGADIESSRRAQDMIGELEASVLSPRVEFIPQCRDGFRSDFAIPRKSQKNAVILYLHGGGYTAGELEYARGFGGVLADITHLTTLCVGYRLAPEHPYPAALDDAFYSYIFLRTAYPDKKIIIAGESAGGGLCYALCLKAKAEGVRQPEGIVAISPWTDLTLSFRTHVTNAAIDPSLTTKTLDIYADMYARNRRSDPFVSPVFGDLSGLPDSLIFVGSHEILLDDSLELADRLKHAGCRATVHVEEGGWHTYVLYATAEARQALRGIKAFVKEKTV